ncbi:MULTISPECIES: M48 family metallopeptidase [Legionella]|uniref:M48 family metallopeptidase n=1 Tax=Legionella TaxID=445 RepID=UPI0009623CC3|nr:MULTISPECIES: SprT family zinc-dependent metalloprotease [Legionella]MBN9226613.1 M48 family metallopeptidase [Legionella steelei]OJW15467.1 MAG: metal-dependent hydrolase [Legionella sp. 39-23]
MPDFKLDDMDVAVVQKNIKNVHLSVYPPVGHVRVSAPEQMSLDAIRAYVISKLNWIRKQQNKFQSQERETTREYIDRESHYFNGKSYLLKLVECDAPPKVQLNHSQILLQIRPGTNVHKKAEIMDNWYRHQLREKIHSLITAWERKIGVSVSKFTIQKMKTKWGSCTHSLRSIRINLELAKKPSEFLEYVVVHELVHLIEPSHNHRFVALMDQFIPKWRFYRDELNRLPIPLDR